MIMKKILLTLACLSLATLMLTLPAACGLGVISKYTVNWSGYVAYAPTPFTSVSATWTVPTVTGSAPAFSAIWTGIGGWYRNSNKLIQAGTEQDALSGGNSYVAWYEVFPQAPVSVGSVNPGDSITVTISENAGNPPSWHITIKDGANKLADLDVKAKTNLAAEATAEFIVERPLLVVGHQIAPLATFGTVTFTSCTTNNGGLNSLTSAYAVTMTSDGTSTGTVLAYPSNPPVGNSFTVSWEAAS